MNDRASTGYSTERDLDADCLAKARSVIDGSTRAVVLNSDCLERLRELPDASVDSCACDPPYGLSQREPDMAEVLARWLGGESYRHEGGGFQGAEWDSFVPGPEVWREVFRVLKPGGYLLAFGAPRRYDLLAVAIRLAGFTVRDSLHWVYANGNGGTKSHNLSLAIDKAAGAKRKVVGQRKTNVGLRGGNYGRGSRSGAVPVTAPATEAAKQWDGWGTSVAPAHEPIIVAQKPVEGTFAGNLLEHGVGGLNIDGCKTSDGRWPKNIVYGHSAECGEACAPGCPVAALDAQHGAGVSDKFPVFRPDTPFLYCAKPSRAEKNAGLDDSFEERRSDTRTGAAAGIWVEKGGAKQKNHHPTAKPVALMQWLCRLVTPPGGVVLDPFAGSGSTGCAAVAEDFRFIGIERDEDYAAIARQRVAHAEEDASRTNTAAPANAAGRGPVGTSNAAALAPPTRTASSAPAPAATRSTGSLAPAPPALRPTPPAPPAPTSPSASASPAAASGTVTPGSQPKLITKLGRFAPGTLALATANSGNKKLGNAATTYAAQTSCPTSCPFFAGGGCYAENGTLGKFITAPLNAAAMEVEHNQVDVASYEAAEIDALEVVPNQPLRLHTVGDCSTDEAAQLIAAASARYLARGGGPVWTYTHAWREVARESWGEVAALASCETAADVELARSRGYAPSVVVERFAKASRHLVTLAESEPAAGVDVLPCREQTSGVPCSECRQCFDDQRLLKAGYAIAFAIHGTPFTVGKATKALLTPDDPDRKLTSRDLIPRTIAEIEAEGGIATVAEIARRIGHSPSSISQMLKTLEREAREAREAENTSAGGCDDSVTTMKVGSRASLGTCPASVESQVSGRRSCS